MYCLILLTTIAFTEIHTLNSDSLMVHVDKTAPRIFEYIRKDNGGRILGSLEEGKLSVEIMRREDGHSVTVDWDDLSPEVELREDQVFWRCAASMDNETAVTFEVAITAKDETVEIATRNIQEYAGYNLMAFHFPPDPIIRVAADMSGAAVCTGNLSGPGSLSPAGSPVSEQFDFGLVVTDKVAAGIYCNVISHPLRGASFEDSTGLWCGDFRYTFKDEHYEPFYCKIGVVADRNGDGRVDWQDAACAIHDFIPKRVNLRADLLRYEANHGLNFAGFVDCTRQFCYLTDGYPQLCLLTGWNGWGWDSEYPSADFPGEEFGGREGLYILHREARKYNCYVSMIHNFDDAYMDSPAWDTDFIAVRPDGSLWNATWWAGGPSYIISPYKLWKTGNARRIIDTLLAQGLEKLIFSDVFSMVPYRESHDRGDKSDPLTNLVLGKFKVLEYLRQHDIYMTSEGFCYEMLGRWIGGHSGFNPGLSDDPDHPPLSLFITHGLMTRKFWRHNDAGRFIGGAPEASPNPWNLDDVYLWIMLGSYYGDKPMRRFAVEGDTYYARYGEDVDVEWKRDDGVRVSICGRLIYDGSSCLLPKRGRPNVFLAYTRTGEQMVYPRPDGWDALDDVVVMKLTAEKPPQVVENDGLVKLEDDHLTLNLPKGVPYKILYGIEKVSEEQKYEGLPPKELTYPLDEVIERLNGSERPQWVLKSTRKALEQNPRERRFVVGCSGCFDTLDAVRQHSASIIARKIAWFVRQKYVNRSREYERSFGWNNGAGDMGYDNWNLGYVTARRLYTLESILQRPDTQWYAEKVRHGPERKVMWKVFMATPVTADEIHDVYIQAAKERLGECQQQLDNAVGDREKVERNIKVYSKLLAEEPSKSPVDLIFDQW